MRSKNTGARKALENVIHLVFLLCGIVAVGFVLVISVYLILSGLPAIRQIGLFRFLFGQVWDPTNTTTGAEYGILPFILTSVYGTAILVLSIMVLPSIINVSETALRAVPREYEEASLALGATAAETYFRVSLHAARSGVATAVVLGVGRAIGEAMAIIMVAGNVANMPGLFRSVRFLTTGIISGMSYAPVGSLYQQALFSIGLVLFLFIMLINVFLNVFIKKRKED